MAKFSKNLLISVGVISILFSQLGAVFAATSPFSQTNWSGGSGQTAFTDNTKYDSGTNINHSVSGQVTIAQSSGWFNNSWSYRKKITFDNSAQAENLVNFPVLVNLSGSNFDYSKAKSAGEDIRFTDSDGTTSLSYEIEKWDAAGTSNIWVKVPQINASSNTDFIYVYYGNSAASDGQSVTSTWNSDFKMVQHLKETANCQTVMQDSTSSDNDLACVSTANATTGKIDGARSFGAGYLAGADSPVFTNSALTVSIWANQTALSTDKTLMSKWFYNNQGSWAIQTDGSDNTRLRLFIANSLTDAGDNNGVTDAGSWSTGWHQVTFTYDGAGSGNSGKVKVYIDGVLQSLTFTGTIVSSLPDSDTFIRVGEFGNLSRVWNGTLDEVKVTNNVQSAAWIAASYKSENSTFNSYAAEETQYPTSAVLTSSIFDTEGTATWGNLTFSATTPTNTTATVKVRTGDSATMVGAPAFAGCTAITTGSDISANSCVTDGQRYVQYQVNLGTTDPVVTPTFSDIAIDFSVPAPTPSPSSNPGLSAPSADTSPPVCTQIASASVPKLGKYYASSNNVDIFFTKPAGEITEYVVSFGYSALANDFSGKFPALPETEIKETIKNLAPGTTYYFKVRTGNGCATGGWSNVIRATTTGLNLYPTSSPIKPIPGYETSLSPVSTPPQEIPETEPISKPPVSLESAPVEPVNPPAPKVSFNPFAPIVSFFQGIGQGFSHQVATAYKTLFEPHPLIITEVQVAEKGPDYAIITWKTNMPSSSKVNFGDSYDYGQDFQTQEKVTEHHVTVTGLEAGKTYFYEVMSQNGGSYSFDARHEFQTDSN